MSDKKLIPPQVPDLARAEGDTVPEMMSWLQSFYEDEGCPWNYRSGTKAIKAGYKGLHRVDLLEAGCTKEKTKQGRISNTEIVRLAAPLAFGRSTQVFDLPPRKFSFGRNRYSAYRIPFFFVEGGIIKLYFLQPRKENGPSFEQLGMIGGIHKKFLLDTEFFGQISSVEYVTLSIEEKKGPRVVHRYSLDDLALWSEKRLTDRLSLISEALDRLDERGDVRSRRRIVQRPEPSMPLFD